VEADDVRAPAPWVEGGQRKQRQEAEEESYHDEGRRDAGNAGGWPNIKDASPRCNRWLSIVELPAAPAPRYRGGAGSIEAGGIAGGGEPHGIGSEA
jgi:hypothetical protein